MPRDLPKAYDPAAIEDRWAAYWADEQLFVQPHAGGAPSAPIFTMLLPPPNVTGRLHMGHMLEHTEMDILTRWRRMCGDLALWIPGTDHAGIATQLMVERQLAEEHKTRQQLGREGFGGAGRRRADNDHRVESGGGELLLERAVHSEPMLDHAGIRPFNFNVFPDQQPVIRACRNHQQARIHLKRGCGLA